MISSIHSLSIAFLDLQPWSIAIFVPIAGLVFAAVFGLAGMYFHHRKQELWHQTARVALEKGQPLPPMLEGMENAPTNYANPQARWRGYFIGGLINIGVGAALYIALGQIPNTHFNVGYFGLIPGFVGVALLIGAAVEAFVSKK